MNVFLDIETIPTQRHRDHVVANISAPGNYKDPAKIAAYIEEQADTEWRKTSLSGLFGEVWCIGYAVEDQEPRVHTRRSLEYPEAELLIDWVEAMHGVPPRWIGHNVSWDLRFLYHRCVVNRVNLRGLDLCVESSPWNAPYADTMAMWAGHRDRVKLSELCVALGVEAKTDMDGSMVWDAVKAGEYQRVSDYCAEDVKATRAVYQRITDVKQ